MRSCSVGYPRQWLSAVQQSSPPWPVTVQEHLHWHWEPVSPPSQQTLSSVQTCQSNPTCYFQKECWAATWDLDCHIATILLTQSVQKYGSYKQCLLRHLPSCTKHFRGLYGEKREKEILHKIIPTGERKQLCLNSSLNDNHDSQPSLWSQPQPQLL